jgi:hypothetical protein
MRGMKKTNCTVYSKEENAVSTLLKCSKSRNCREKLLSRKRLPIKERIICKEQITICRVESYRKLIAQN